MTQAPRMRSETDTYHVYSRGVGGHILFEDDTDRAKFFSFLEETVIDSKAELCAYCIMGNHYHLVIRQQLDDLSVSVGTLQSRYAKYFNWRHDRYGHLFQGRFGSKPIHSEEHLLTVVRYVHLNPVADGLSRSCSYRWSSYNEYVGKPRIVKPDLVLAILGGVEQFRMFHEHAAEEVVAQNARRSHDLAASNSKTPISGHNSSNRLSVSRLSMEDVEAIERIKRAFGADVLERLRVSEKPERDEIIRSIRKLGFTNSRIVRITGLGRSIVSRA